MAEYRIIVDFNGGKGGDGYKSPKKESEPIDDEAINNEQLANTVFGFAKQGANAFAGLFTVATAVETARNIFSHEVQKIGRYTGSQQAQDVANASMSIIGKFVSPLSSAINMAYEIDNANYAKKWESIGLELYRERGGVAINRSRTEL